MLRIQFSGATSAWRVLLHGNLAHRARCGQDEQVSKTFNV